MLWTNLASLKSLLEIDQNDHSQDWLLNHFNEWVTDIIETLLNRKLTYATRTWYYQGSGIIKLLLKHRPVYPTTPPPQAATLPFTTLVVSVDQQGNFGEAVGAFAGTPLIYGTDYCIKIDRDDGGSDEAILYMVGGYWPRPVCRQPGLLSPFIGTDLGSIQVTSTAGYTIDTLPAQLKMAAEMMVARLAYIFPLGMETTSESYIDRSIALSPEDRDYLYGMVKHLVWAFRNWRF
jgi:hypothetical protein